MTYHQDCSKSSTTDDTRGAEATYPSGTPEFTPVVSGVHVLFMLSNYIISSRFSSVV